MAVSHGLLGYVGNVFTREAMLRWLSLQNWSVRIVGLCCSFLPGQSELEYSLPVYKQHIKSTFLPVEAEIEGAHDVNHCCGILGQLEQAADKAAELVWKIYHYLEEIKPRELFVVLTALVKHGIQLIY